MHWFLDPIKNHYADFKGRATRQEYWMFVLFYVIIYVVLAFIDALIGMQILTFILALALIVPSVALAARRLHDTGKSGWWQLIALIPFVGWIIAIVLLALPGKKEDNEYGPSPYGGATPVAAPAAPEMQVDENQQV